MTGPNAAQRFVERINAHDPVGMVALMTADHTFIDSLGESIGRPDIERGWRQYFEMVPDYWIRVARAISDGDVCVLIGMAGGTYVPEGGAAKPENRWETPAVWVARIDGRKVAEWRIYSDNEPIRAKMRKSNPRNSR